METIRENEQEKIKKWHQDAEKGKQAALRRERNISCFVVIVLFMIVAILLYIGYVIWRLIGF